MSETEICAYCLTSEHPIDVRGLRILQSGAEVRYLICHSCCTVLRRFHFNDEPIKMKQFWNLVWGNLSLEECIEPIEDQPEPVEKVEPVAPVAPASIDDDAIVASIVA